jgi:hypothetical protein
MHLSKSYIEHARMDIYDFLVNEFKRKIHIYDTDHSNNDSKYTLSNSLSISRELDIPHEDVVYIYLGNSGTQDSIRDEIYDEYKINCSKILFKMYLSEQKNSGDLNHLYRAINTVKNDNVVTINIVKSGLIGGIDSHPKIKKLNAQCKELKDDNIVLRKRISDLSDEVMNLDDNNFSLTFAMKAKDSEIEKLHYLLDAKDKEIYDMKQMFKLCMASFK